MTQRFFLLLLILSSSIHAQVEHSGQELYKRAEIVSVGQQNLTLEAFLKLEPQLEFSSIQNEIENVDFTNDHHWVRFSLENNTLDTQHYFLRTARPITDVVDLYQISEDEQVKTMKTGDTRSFTEKDFPHRESILSLYLSPQSNYTFYLHLKSDGEMITLPLALFEPEAFIADSDQTEFLFGLFYGVLLITAIIYLFFYVSLRQSAFLFYGLYIIFFGALQFTLDGYTHQYIFTDSGWLYSKLVLLTAACSTIFLGLYTERFLDLRERLKVIPLILRIIYALVILLVIGMLISESFMALTYPIINGLALFMIVIIITAIVKLNVKNVYVDPLFSTGIFFLTLGLIVFILNNFSLIPSNFVTQNSSKIGGALEIIFLSLSMSNLIRQLREEKEKSQEVALQKAEEANDLKLHLMSNVSHELRTPLNAIMGITEKIQRESNLNDQQFKDMGIIQHSSEILLGSINNLLDFYKIEKGELKLEHKAFNLHKALKQFDANWRQSMDNKPLAYNFQLDRKLPEYIYGDIHRLIQIIDNVFENAIKFTQEGAIGLHAQFKDNDGKPYLQLSISDTGVGIPQEKLKSIWSGFSQERIDDKRVFGGLGLGLSIAKELAKLQGGQLRIKSAVGVGTTCTLDLPMDIVPKTKIPMDNIKINAPELPDIHILIVEDNALNQMVVKQMLNGWKNTTYALAENGAEAIDKLKADRFDLILLDLQMPVMDGYEAAQLIRGGSVGEHHRHIPIIAVTADTTEQTKERVMSIGINDYQSKPFNMQALYSKVYKQVGVDNS